MIITLTRANFSASNIGTLSTWRITRSLGIGATYEGVTSVDKGAAFSGTVTIADGYELGAAGVTVTMGGDVISAATVNRNVITISIASVTGNVVIKVPTVNVSTGEEDDNGNDNNDSGNDNGTTIPAIEGYTAQTLTASNYRLASITESGVGTDGSSGTRLSYGQVLEVPSSGRIIITCPEGYSIGVRSGSSKTKLTDNQYWFNSGDEIQIAGAGMASNGKAYFAFCLANFGGNYPPFSVTGTADGLTAQNMTKDIANEITLYYKDEYTAEFNQVSNYNLVQTLSIDANDWKLTSVGASGYGEDGSNDSRLAYGTPFTSDILHDNTIMVTCDKNYLWAVRVSGNNGSSYDGNMYWYHSGTPIRLSNQSNKVTSATASYKFIIIFAKMDTPVGVFDGSAAGGHITTVTKADAALAAPSIYTAKSDN